SFLFTVCSNPPQLKSFATRRSSDLAIFGSLERFVGIVLENFAGHMPLWLAPVQATVCTIVSDADGYAEDVQRELQEAGLRAEVRSEEHTSELQSRENLGCRLLLDKK